METNCYYHDYIDRLNDGPSPEPDVTEAELFVFLTLTIQMGHDVRDELTDYLATVDQLYAHFYGSVIRRDRYLYILVTYILLTTGMNLMGQKKILQTVEDTRPV